MISSIFICTLLIVTCCSADIFNEAFIETIVENVMEQSAQSTINYLQNEYLPNIKEALDEVLKKLNMIDLNDRTFECIDASTFLLFIQHFDRFQNEQFPIVTMELDQLGGLLTQSEIRFNELTLIQMRRPSRSNQRRLQWQVNQHRQLAMNIGITLEKFTSFANRIIDLFMDLLAQQERCTHKLQPTEFDLPYINSQ